MRYLKQVISALLLTSPLFFERVEADPSEVINHVDALKALQTLQDDCWSHRIRYCPELATFVGSAGDHGSWTDYSPEAFEFESAALSGFQKRLQEIDRNSLTIQHQLQYDILQWTLDNQKGKEQFHFEYLALDQMNGFHLTIPLILQIVTEQGDAGYEAIISRMEGIPLLVDQQIALLREGINNGIVVPKIVMRSVPDQILNQISLQPEQSEFYLPFLTLNNSALQQKALDAIKDKIYPAFRQLHAFIAEEYIPSCRETTGMCDLPNGRTAYALLVKDHTTTALTPQEIHQIGLAEVARVQTEMELVMNECQFHGTTHEFADHLNADPSSFYNTKEELLQGYRDLLSTIESNLPQLFNILPTLPCEIVPIPEYAEASAIMAYYYPGSVETDRPGRFFVNTFNLKDSPKWQMESLALHEALPGHHFQISISQSADLPLIQKHNWTTAFIEGWGLYSESLGKELGLYQNPQSYFGRLCHEMLRALRLVVDTGIHELGWSRDEAISYYKKYLPVSENEIINEIDRYIVMPAQALAYKIGEITIKSWRHHAQQQPNFNIRTFHDDLLQLGGCLPLDVLNKYFKTPPPLEGSAPQTP